MHFIISGSHQQLGPDEEEPVEAEPADGKGKGKAKLKVGQPQPPKGEQPPKGDQPVKGGKKFSTMSYQTVSLRSCLTVYPIFEA